MCALEGKWTLKKFRFLFCNRRVTFSSVYPTGKILIVLLLLAAAAGATAATPLSAVSCVGSAYNGTATDACSVTLTSTAGARSYVSLSSNNPAVTVPAQVVVKHGSLSAGFSATVAAVSTAQAAKITAQAGGVVKTFSISLSPPAGTGTAQLKVNATSIAFGSVVVNTPVAQALTLTSSGTAAVTVNAAAASGTGFSVSGSTFPMTLNPGASLTLEVQFDPASVGSYSGQLTISSNTATQTVALTGTGASHQVGLNWVAPSGSGDPVTGYNVYRAPSGTTSYQRLNSSIETQTAFTDSSVQAGSSYDYIVKSVDSSGVESAPSNTTSVTVP